VANFGNGFYILKVAGVDTPTVSTGSVETGNVIVTENADIGNDAYVHGGMSIRRDVWIGGLVSLFDNLSIIGSVDVKGGVHTDSSFVVGSSTTYADGSISSSSALNIDSGTLFIDTSNDTIGLGTTAPKSRFHVDEGSILFEGELFGTSGTPTSGEGARLMWIPSKAAFRAGYVGANEWDNNKIGNYSIAMGRDAVASLHSATAIGYTAVASNVYSVAIGTNAVASGWAGTAFGSDTTASGEYSTAMGLHTTAAGDYSTSLGQEIIVNGQGSVGIGLSNTAYTVSNANTMAIMGGNVGIGVTSPSSRLEVNGDIEVQDDDWIGISASNERITFDADGNDIEIMGAQVGIGTLSPADSLDVAGGIRVDDYIRARDSNGLGLRTDEGTTRLLVKDDGRVGIGTTSPGELLDVYGKIRLSEGSYSSTLSNNGGALLFETDNPYAWTSFRILPYEDDIWWQNSQSAGNIYFSGSAGNWLTGNIILKTSNRVGIGTDAPGYTLDVAGSAHATSFPTSSDIRLKENITQLTDVLEKIQKIRGVSFDWNKLYESFNRSSGHREIGVIAQEVAAVFPELVTTWGEEEYMAVDYGRLTGVLIEAVKELKAENDELKEKIDLIEEQQIQINNLLQRVESLENK